MKLTIFYNFEFLTSERSYKYINNLKIKSIYFNFNNFFFFDRGREIKKEEKIGNLEKLNIS